MTDHQTKYLSEVGSRLRREGFTVQPEYAGLLPIEKTGPVMQITGTVFD